MSKQDRSFFPQKLYDKSQKLYDSSAPWNQQWLKLLLFCVSSNHMVQDGSLPCPLSDQQVRRKEKG